jgi:ABC-type glycerol-3-phosphate transport system substrate-binding protein
MRTRISRTAAATAAALVALAVAGQGSASAANTRVCPNNYTLTSAALTWYYPFQDTNGDGYVCLKYDRTGTLVAITDDTIR